MRRKLLVLATRHIGDKTSGADTRLIKQLSSISDQYDIYILHKKNIEHKPKLYFDIKEEQFIKKVFSVTLYEKGLKKVITKILPKPTFYGKSNWLNFLDEVIDEVNPDVIQCDLFLASYYLPKKYLSKSIGYGQDSMSRFSKSGYSNSKSYIQKLKYLIEFYRYSIYENCYSKFPKSVFVSSEDVKYLKKGDINIINLAVNEQNYVANPNNYKILFFGNLSYLPNVNSILWFIENVLPNLRKKCSKIKLVIAGSNVNTQIREVSKQEFIELIDTPEDMFEVIKNSHIVILPILWGSGQKNKVLEAMASYRPIVCSEHAIEGTSIENKKHVMIANNEEEYVNLILQLLNDKALANHIVEESISFINKYFSKDVLKVKYLKLLNSI
jgi:glycosyltransferase involved in cell wall biosynthesis